MSKNDYFMELVDARCKLVESTHILEKLTQFVLEDNEVLTKIYLEMAVNQIKESQEYLNEGRTLQVV